MPTSDRRLQELQEQLEESQRELAKAHAEAAKSAASQQQEPAATAQNMTSTIQTGKKSTTTTKLVGIFTHLENSVFFNQMISYLYELGDQLLNFLAPKNRIY